MAAEAKRIRQAVAGDWPAIENLLLRAGLPSEDLDADRVSDFLLARDNAELCPGTAVLMVRSTGKMANHRAR